MKDIKEYFTANKHPLISRSARINQRLRAATGLDRERRRIRQRPVAGSGKAGISCGGRQMAGPLTPSPHQQSPAWRSYTKFNQRSTALVNPTTDSNKVLCPTQLLSAFAQLLRSHVGAEPATRWVPSCSPCFVFVAGNYSCDQTWYYKRLVNRGRCGSF